MSKHTPNLCECGDQPTLHKYDSDDHQVICCCGRRGPRCPTECYALKRWNRQTAALDLLEAAKTIVGYADNPALIEMHQAAKYLLEHTVFGTDIQIAIAKAEPKAGSQ